MIRALLVLPSLAFAGTFVTDPGTTLPGPKTDARSLPVGADPNGYLRATDYNAIRDAANDLRDYVRAPNDGRVTATGSSAARRLADRFADVANVEDFGASCNMNRPTPRPAVHRSRERTLGSAVTRTLASYRSTAF